MDPIWNHFTCLMDGWMDDSEVTAQCKLCLEKQSIHIAMIKAHYDKFVTQTRTSEPQQQGEACPVPDPKPIIMETSPGHKPPTREKPSATNGMYQAVTKQQLNDETITMQRDGWSTIQK